MAVALSLPEGVEVVRGKNSYIMQHIGPLPIPLKRGSEEIRSKSVRVRGHYACAAAWTAVAA
jgi:hypothetical protein